MGAWERVPMYPFPAHELRVELLKDEDKVLASFQNVVRREIRKCAEISYRIHSSDSPELLVQAWPIFLRMCERKGQQFYRRFVESYRSLVQLAKAHNCAKLYTAHLGGRLVQAILVVRDYDTGHYIAGALDVDALCGQKPSPSCLLHWTAMKDLIRSGSTRHDLGLLGVGSLQIFKNKFHPGPRRFPASSGDSHQSPLSSLDEGFARLTDAVFHLNKSWCRVWSGHIAGQKVRGLEKNTSCLGID
jgi:Acetyltransferase (GNAT) domain